MIFYTQRTQIGFDSVRYRTISADIGRYRATVYSGVGSIGRYRPISADIDSEYSGVLRSTPWLSVVSVRYRPISDGNDRCAYRPISGQFFSSFFRTTIKFNLRPHASHHIGRYRTILRCTPCKGHTISYDMVYHCTVQKYRTVSGHLGVHAPPKWCGVHRANTGGVLRSTPCRSTPCKPYQMARYGPIWP